MLYNEGRHPLGCLHSFLVFAITMSVAPAINYKLGNEKLIKVLPNAANKLTSLLTRQGRAEHGALRVAFVNP